MTQFSSPVSSRSHDSIVSEMCKDHGLRVTLCRGNRMSADRQYVSIERRNGFVTLLDVTRVEQTQAIRFGIEFAKEAFPHMTTVVTYEEGRKIA